jgi:hypothetical protein
MAATGKPGHLFQFGIPRPVTIAFKNLQAWPTFQMMVHKNIYFCHKFVNGLTLILPGNHAAGSWS